MDHARARKHDTDLGNRLTDQVDDLLPAEGLGTLRSTGQSLQHPPSGSHGIMQKRIQGRR